MSGSIEMDGETFADMRTRIAELEASCERWIRQAQEAEQRAVTAEAHAAVLWKALEQITDHATDPTISSRRALGAIVRCSRDARSLAPADCEAQIERGGR